MPGDEDIEERFGEPENFEEWFCAALKAVEAV